MTILVCDDDKEIVEAIEIYLMQEGYNVEKAYDGQEALKIVKDKKIDLMIIDVMMPKLDGIRATLQIRKESKIPIIILSAKTEDADKILGLNIGADDYMTKPFNPLELVARVKSQLRRYTQLGSTSKEDSKYEFKTGGLVIRDDLKRVTVDGETVKLTPIEFEIFNLLFQNHGSMVSSAKLLKEIWGYGPDDDVETIRVHVRHLRSKIAKISGDKKYIVTIYGGGYKLDI